MIATFENWDQQDRITQIHNIKSCREKMPEEIKQNIINKKDREMDLALIGRSDVDEQTMISLLESRRDDNEFVLDLMRNENVQDCLELFDELIDITIHENDVNGEYSDEMALTMNDHIKAAKDRNTDVGRALEEDADLRMRSFIVIEESCGIQEAKYWQELEEMQEYENDGYDQSDIDNYYDDLEF